MSSKTPKVNDDATAWARKLLPIVIGIVSLLFIWISTKNGSTRSVIVEGTEVRVALADTTASRAKGLSGKTNLAKNQGMLFILDKPDRGCIWMKDMKFPIDVLWFDANKKLVDKVEQVTVSTYPNTFCSEAFASYILEVPAGFARQIGANTFTTTLETVAF